MSGIQAADEPQLYCQSVAAQGKTGHGQIGASLTAGDNLPIIGHKVSERLQERLGGIGKGAFEGLVGDGIAAVVDGHAAIQGCGHAAAPLGFVGIADPPRHDYGAAWVVGRG